MKVLGLLFVCISAIVAAVCIWFYVGFVTARPTSNQIEVIYEVTPGASFRHISYDLTDKGLVKSAWKFLFLAKLRGDGSRVRVGEYALRANMTPGEILEVITSGRSVAHLVTMAEGWNTYELAALLEGKGLTTSKEFLRLCHDPKLIFELLGERLPSLEGYLFPETYNMTKYTGAEGLIRMMVQRFIAVYSSIEGASKSSMPRHETVTLASIIEKETGASEERPLISSVFHNRLHIHMKLQTDPTVLYGLLDKTGVAHVNITREDLQTPTRYNTYVLASLPYGPIANPGRAALEAAVKPAQSNYLYFVSRNDGTHIFSSNYADHVAAVRRFQLDPRARAGKSWRDLKKNRAQMPVVH